MSLENKMEHGSPHFSAVTAIISSLCTAWLQKTHQSHCNGHRLIDMVQWSTLGLLLVQLYHYWWFIGFMIDGLLINGLLKEISPVPWKLRPFPLILLIRKSANAPLVTLVSSGLLQKTLIQKQLLIHKHHGLQCFTQKKTCSCWACASAVCGLQDSSLVAASTGHQTRGRATRCRSRLENGNVALRRQGRHLQKCLVTRC